jgi:hypothetical protein
MPSSVLGGTVKSRLVASIALGAAVILGATGCSLISTQATTIPYSPAEGVNVPDSGPLEVRNAFIVANEDGSAGNFVAAVVNPTDTAHTLSVEFGEPGDTATATVRVPANSVVSLGAGDEDPILLEGPLMLPGSDVPGFFQSGDGEGVLLSVPILDGSLDYLASLVP